MLLSNKETKRTTSTKQLSLHFENVICIAANAFHAQKVRQTCRVNNFIKGFAGNFCCFSIFMRKMGAGEKVRKIEMSGYLGSTVLRNWSITNILLNGQIRNGPLASIDARDPPY